jgi:hypothetical protein
MNCVFFDVSRPRVNPKQAVELVAIEIELRSRSQNGDAGVMVFSIESRDIPVMK